MLILLKRGESSYTDEIDRQRDMARSYRLFMLRSSDKTNINVFSILMGVTIGMYGNINMLKQKQFRCWPQTNRCLTSQPQSVYSREVNWLRWDTRPNQEYKYYTGIALTITSFILPSFCVRYMRMYKYIFFDWVKQKVFLLWYHLSNPFIATVLRPIQVRPICLLGQTAVYI